MQSDVFQSRPYPTLRYKGALIEQVESFTYLGMVFTSALQLKQAAERWGGSMFAALRNTKAAAKEKCVDNMPHAMLSLFQTFVRPHAMFASQVWATTFLQIIPLKCPLQPRYVSFLCHLLKVKRSAPSKAILSETCQLPFQFNWLKAVLTFWNACISGGNRFSLRVCVSDAILSSSYAGCWCAQVDKALSKPLSQH